jgi:hypothetical protein
MEPKWKWKWKWMTNFKLDAFLRGLVVYVTVPGLSKASNGSRDEWSRIHYRATMAKNFLFRLFWWFGKPVQFWLYHQLLVMTASRFDAMPMAMYLDSATQTLVISSGWYSRSASWQRPRHSNSLRLTAPDPRWGNNGLASAATRISIRFKAATLGNILIDPLQRAIFLNKALLGDDEWLHRRWNRFYSYLAITRCSTVINARHSLFVIKARNACFMLHFYNLAAMALHQLTVPTDTPYLFERLGQL